MQRPGDADRHFLHSGQRVRRRDDGAARRFGAAAGRGRSPGRDRRLRQRLHRGAAGPGGGRRHPALSTALAREEERLPAVVTFVTTVSGLSLFGIGAAFWGLVAGGAMMALDRLKG
ncbi:benzoate/H(+) symporter BenE family transporter [Inquilinus sp. NPDC058860]|uniref:benzoate/H(+) symporter BenE family transporter n=1 Tax=Inquilinus sp. NPDC058860 TaxID=3346652 RepID=UPI00369A7173